MNTCEYAGYGFTEPRSHPWTDTAGNPEARYYDLTVSPEHIRSSLEDFLPFAHYAAVEDFYALVARLNQTGSVLESNDCAFTGPCANETPSMPKARHCSGRLMVLFRALERNVQTGQIEALKNQLHHALMGLDRSFRWGVVGTTLIPVRYLALPDGEQLGLQLMISFWAWGDSDADTMRGLQRLFRSLSQALAHVSRHTAA